EHTAFQNPVVYGFLQRLASADSPENIEILDLAQNEEEQALITRLSVEPGFDPEQSDAVIEDCLKKLDALQLESKIRSARHAGDLKLL
ncbi:MAG: hypothetical protein GWN86_23700, partial [Desulfobacterales bacterium]|nr:hypothetical protein [Desulfobacterales bacterium]